MANIGNASIGVQVDPARFAAGMKRVESQFTSSMKRMDAQKATADIDADLSQLKRDIAKAQLMLRSLQDQRIEMKLTGGPEAERSIRAIDRQMLVLRKQITGLKEDQFDLNTGTKALAKTTARHDLEVNRLRSSYVKLKSEIDSLNPSFRLFTDRVQQIRLDKLNSELDDVRARLHTFGRSTDDLDVVVDRHNGTLRRWVSNLGEIRLHLGFFSLSLRQFALIAGAGANVLSGLAGALSSLISVTGAGLAGAIGLGTSALLSFGLAGAGVVGIMKPLIEDFGNAKKAIDAYDDAVLKYGKNSTQAASKLEQMERVVGSLTKTQRDAISSAQQLGARWRELTASARPAFFRTLSEGIKTLNDLMPTLARRSVEAFEAASRGTERWFRGLRSAEAERLISSMMKNATAAIGPLMDALGNLGTWIGRISKSFSRFLEPVMSGFEEWTQGLADGVANTQDLNKDVDSLMDSLSSLGSFLSAGVSLMHNFFAAGVGEGRKFMDSLTETLQRWNEWTKSLEGRSSIAEWMRRGVETTKSFVSAIAELGKALIQLGPVTRVVFEAFVGMATALGKLGQAVLSIPGATSTLRAFVAAFLGLQAGKAIAGIVTGLATAFGTLGRSLAGLAAGSSAAGLVATGGGLAGLLGKLSGFARFLPGLGAAVGIGVGLFGNFGSSAADAAEQVQRLTEQTQAVDSAMSGLETAGADFLSNRVQQAQAARELTEAEREVEQLLNAGKKGTEQYAVAMDRLRMARVGISQSNAQMKQSEQALLNVGPQRQRAIEQLKLAFQRFGDTAGGLTDVGRVLPQINNDLRTTGTVSQQTQQRLLNLGVSQERVNQIVNAGKIAFKDYRMALQQGQQTFPRWAKAIATATLGVTEGSRKFRQARQDLQGLLATFGKRIPKMLIEVKDEEAARKIVNLAAKANELGGPRAREKLIRIITRDDNAKSKIENLKNLVSRIKDGEFKVTAKTEGARGDIDSIMDGARDIDRLSPEFTIDADESPALGAVSAAKAAGADFDNDVYTATLNYSLGSVPRGPKGAGFAGGIIGAAQGMSGRELIRAFAQASQQRMQRTGISRKINRPTLLTGEEAPTHPEFVIATNPAYRQRNVSFLQQAAQALGIPLLGMKKGGKVGKRFRVGGVPEDTVSGKLNNAQQRHSTARDRRKTLEDKTDPKAPPAKIAEARRKEQAAEKEKQKWKARYDAVRKVNRSISLHEARINNAGTRMDLAQEKGDSGMFNNWRGFRNKQLKSLRSILQKAAGGAGGHPEFRQQLKEKIAATSLAIKQQPTFESASAGSLMEWLEQGKGGGKRLKNLLHKEVLATETTSPQDDLTALKQTLSFLQGMNRAKMPKEVVEDLIGMIVDRRDQISSIEAGGGVSLEDLLTPEEKQRMDQLRRGEVIASVTPGTADDEAARRASLPFFEQLFARLRAGGAPTDVLEQVASEITSRRDSLGPTLGEQAFTFGKERYNLFKQFSSNFIPASQPSPPTAASYNNPPSSYAPAGGGDSQVNITNNYQEPPPDPHTWSKQQEYEVRAATA